MKGLRIIRVLATVVVGSAALLAAAVAVLLVVDLSAYRGVLESRLSSVLDRHVLLNGELRVSLTPLPTVTATRVAIVNPDWASERYLASVERLAVGLSVVPLLSGELRIARVQLTGGEVHLETRPDGTGNWLPDRAARPPAAAPGPVALPAVLPRVTVRRSRVEFRDGRSGVVTPLEIDRAEVAAPADGPFSLDVQGSLRGGAFTAKVRGGSLRALLAEDAPWPLRISLAGSGNRIGAEGHLWRRPVPRFDLKVQAAGEDFAQLGPLVGAPLPDWGPFRLNGQLTRDATGYALRDVSGFLGRPQAALRFTVNEGHVAAPFAEPLALEVAGRYRGEPFRLSAQASPYARLLEAREPWAGRASLHLRHSRLALEGRLHPATRDFTATVEADGDDLASLTPVAGRPLPHLGPYVLEASVSREGAAWEVPRFSIQAGVSNLRGALALDTAGPRPRISGRVQSDTLDLGTLREALAAVTGDAERPAPRLSVADRPLPADWLQRLDGRLALELADVRGAGPPLAGLDAEVRVQDGALEADVAHVGIAGEPLAGRIALQATGGAPRGELVVIGHDLTYGPVLAALTLTDRLAGHAERLRFTLRGNGHTLREIWRDCVMELAVEHGLLSFVSRKGGVPELIGVDSGQATLGQHTGLAGTAQGHFRGRPYDLRVAAGGLRDLLDPAQPWAVDAQGSYGDAALRVSGNVLDPAHARGATLKLHAAGARLGDLGHLLGVALPPLGPYRVAATLSDAARGVVVQDIDAKLGQSDLAGELTVADGDVGPQVRASLRSRTLRMADLRPAKPRAGQARPAQPRNTDDAEAAAPAAAPAEDSAPEGVAHAIPPIAYPLEGLRRMEMELAFTAQRLQVGAVDFGQVSLEGRLEDGRLTLAPVRGRLWGGAVTGSFAVDATADPTRTRLTLEAKDVEYTRATAAPGKAGVTHGTISLVARLEGTGPGLQEAAASAEGVVEFLGGSGSIDNRLLDLWASDLFLAALPEFGERRSTPVRCLLGRFTVKDGRAETKSLLADLDRLVVKGAGSIDLKDETLDLLLWPEPRDRSLLRVTTPMQVTGTLSSPSIHPQARGVLEDVTWLFIGASNPFVLLFGLIHPGSPDQDPCALAAERGAKSAAEAEYSPPTPLSKAWNFLKGLGHMMAEPFEEQPTKPEEPAGR